MNIRRIEYGKTVQNSTIEELIELSNSKKLYRQFDAFLGKTEQIPFPFQATSNLVIDGSNVTGHKEIRIPYYNTSSEILRLPHFTNKKTFRLESDFSFDFSYDPAAIDVISWSSTGEYSINDVVFYNGHFWKANQAISVMVNSTVPSDANNKWQKFDPPSLYESPILFISYIEIMPSVGDSLKIFKNPIPVSADYPGFYNDADLVPVSILATGQKVNIKKYITLDKIFSDSKVFVNLAAVSASNTGLNMGMRLDFKNFHMNFVEV